MKTLILLAALVVTLGLPKIGSAQAAGDLDRSFSDDGMLVTDFPGIPSVVGSAVAVLSDGRIFVAGSAQREDAADFAMSCYDRGGNLEPSFGIGGKTTLDFGGDEEITYAMAVQGDDKIVVAGSSDTSFTIGRLNPDGSLDTTFDGDGKVSINMGGPAHVWDAAIQSDGKILIAGWTYWRTYTAYALTVSRLNRDGSLDTTFDGDGTVHIFGGDRTTRISQDPVAVAVQPDGKIVLAGNAYTGHPSGYDFLVVRLNNDGRLDGTFDSDGRVMTNFSGDDNSSDLVIQPNGKIVLAGTVGNPTFIAVLRYNSNGTLDNTFGGDGIVTTDFGSPRSDEAAAALLQPDGKIVVVGSTISEGASMEDFAVIRYNPDGSLDTGFSGDGMQVTSFGEKDLATGVVLQPDGKILVAGFSCQNDHYPDNCRFAMARYLGEPTDRPEGRPDRRRGGGKCTGIPSLDRFNRNCRPFWEENRRWRIPAP